jgi:hypothetical protein
VCRRHTCWGHAHDAGDARAGGYTPGAASRAGRALGSGSLGGAAQGTTEGLTAGATQGAREEGRRGGEEEGEGGAYHGLDRRQQPLFDDPNAGRQRVGERRKRERVVSHFLDHGCAGKGSGGGGTHGGRGHAWGEVGLGARQGWAGLGCAGADSLLLDLACF